MNISFNCKTMPRTLRKGHLKMGDSDLNSNRIDVNSLYLTENEKPILPIMGEFHFSRYNPENWEEELIKMKSCGISVIASYFFWNHHEETEGLFDFTGRRDVRAFIKTCQKVGLRVFIRPGPWAHGEARYGGFPDWLMKKGFDLRHNDERYLKYVRRLYGEYFNQLTGLFYYEGGPIIGMQLDNELQNDADHLLELKNIAVEIGFRVPIYTITGWGPGCLAPFPENEVIPVFGGYPDAPWEQNTFPLAPSPHYGFAPGRNDTTIGNDQMKSGTVNPDEKILEPYPYVTCELGPGVQHTYHRRPVIDPMDVYTPAMTKLSRGNNMPGYYVFHGGFNPVRYGTTYQESLETGYPNDLPVLSYDFQAPIGEFGFVKQSYSYYRMLHAFINENQSKLAVAQPFTADTMPKSMSEPCTPRFGVRAFCDGENSYGYLFYTTHMRNYPLEPIRNADVSVHFENETINIDNINIPTGKTGLFPLNFTFGNIKFSYITAQPVTVVEDKDEKTYFFAANDGVRVNALVNSDAEFDTCLCEKQESFGNMKKLCNLPVSKKAALSYTDSDGKKYNIVFLSFDDALNLVHVKTNTRDFAVISENPVFFDDENVWLETQNTPCGELYVYPCEAVSALEKTGEDGVFAKVKYTSEAVNKDISIEKRAPQITGENFFTKFLFTDNPSECDEYELSVNPDILDDVHDVRIMLEIHGDVIQAYSDEMLVHDFFNMGVPVEIGLRRFKDTIKSGKPIVFKISKFTEDKKVYLQRHIDFDKTSVQIVKTDFVNKISL